MKKISKFCCCNSGTDGDQPPLRQRSKSQRSLRLDREVFRVGKQENAFSVMKAHVTPNGDSHSIVISFNEEGETQIMKLIINGATFYTVDTKEQLRGNTDLNIDGLVVDFVWELDQVPKFSFFTRDSSVDTNVVGSSSGGGNDSESASSAKPWQDHEHIYVLQIIGM